MGVRDITDAFNEISERKCFQVTMEYVDGGKAEKYTFKMTDGGEVVLTLEAAHTPQKIAKLALESLGGG